MRPQMKLGSSKFLLASLAAAVTCMAGRASAEFIHFESGARTAISGASSAASDGMGPPPPQASSEATRVHVSKSARAKDEGIACYVKTAP